MIISLVSINKKYTGQGDPEFNLRHDWNSLLTTLNVDAKGGTDFPFTNFSDEYFPHRDTLYRYIGAYASEYNLRIATDTNVKSIVKDSDDGNFKLDFEPSAGFSLRCKTVVWATGLGTARRFNNELYTSYDEMPVDAEFYKNKTVAIVGAGQSAFECAKAIYGKSATTMMLYRNPPSLSWNTHYVGHIRAINNEILDAYQHKSLDALVQLNDHADNKWIESLARRDDGKLYYPGLETRLGTYFDIVISAVGWQFDFSPFSNSTRPKMMEVSDTGDRYPRIDSSFQSTNVPGLYFAGTLAHGIDKGRSSGGFIHGFRYNVRALARILLTEKGCEKHRNMGKCVTSWPNTNVGCMNPDQRVDLSVSKFAKSIMDRIGRNSALYQMFDELQDVYVFHPSEQCLYRYEEVPKRYVNHLLTSLNIPDMSVFTVTFKYREGFSTRDRDVFDSERVVIPQLPPKMLKGGLAYKEMANGWDKLNFLHPVLESLHYSSKSCSSLINEPFHLLEDLVTTWSRPLDLIPLVEFLMVRVISNPCDFADDKENVKLLQTYWRLFITMASGGSAKISAEGKQSYKVPSNMNQGERPAEITKVG